jgi:5'-nucleotidase
MNILVVNDDGIETAGIKALVQALSKVADVYVCAPDRQNSGKSQSISIKTKVYVTPAEFPCAKGALKTTGTPADCTKIGLQFFAEEGHKIDMVYAGINHGSNLGKDTLYSGTVGAAMEGAVSGCHAVAVSVDSHQASHFDVACEMAVDVMDYVLNKTTTDTILNINVPDLPREEIKGIKYTTLGGRYYIDKFEEQAEGGYILDGEPHTLDDEAGVMDITAISENYASVTPLHFDYTQYEKIEDLKHTGLEIHNN